MRAMFRVTFRQAANPTGSVFACEVIVASGAGEAVKKTEAKVKRVYVGERLFVSEVELLGVESE